MAEFFVPECNHSLEFAIDNRYLIVGRRRFVFNRNDEGKFLGGRGCKLELEAKTFAVGIVERDVGERFGGGESHYLIVINRVIDIANAEGVVLFVPFGIEVTGSLFLTETEYKFVNHVELHIHLSIGLINETNLIVLLLAFESHKDAYIDMHVFVVGIKGRIALTVASRRRNKLLLVDEKHLAGIVPDDIVAPSCEFELLGIVGEREASHRRADHTTEMRISNHIDPRHGCIGVGHHIVTSITVESAVLVIEGQIAPHTELLLGA